jgi:hypothetical protein
MLSAEPVRTLLQPPAVFAEIHVMFDPPAGMNVTVQLPAGRLRQFQQRQLRSLQDRHDKHELDRREARGAIAIDVYGDVDAFRVPLLVPKKKAGIAGLFYA